MKNKTLALMVAMIIAPLFFISCSKSPIKKAEKLIEATASNYKEEPKFDFSQSKELVPVIDKATNSVIGYTLDYSVLVGGQKLDFTAKFDKEVQTLTSNDVRLSPSTKALMEAAETPTNTQSE